MNRFSQRKSFLSVFVPIFIGFCFVSVFVMFAAQIWAIIFVVQNPEQVGTFVKDLLAPIIQELKK